MPTLVWYVIMLVISLALSYLLQKPPASPKAATLGDFNTPTAEEGRAIPVVFGTVRLEAPNVVWYGDLNIAAITDRPSSMSKKITTGYKYSLGMQMALCHGPIDALAAITVGDKGVPAFSTSTVNNAGGIDYFKWIINANDLFGGDKQEGGLIGQVSLHPGNETQGVDGYLSGQFGGQVSAYPGLCYAVLSGTTFTYTTPLGNFTYSNGSFYLGTSKYLKNWAFTVQRFPRIPGQIAGHERIGNDANAANIVYEYLTNGRWGLGINTTRIDTASFLAAGETFFAETFGMSLVIDRSKPADQALADIQQTMDCVVYTDPATGLWTMKPIRNDYDPATLTAFTQDDLKEAPVFSRPSWSETINQVKVNYTDAAQGWTTRTAIAMDGGNYAVQGQTAAHTASPVGVTNVTNANRIANRLLRNLSYPLAKVTLTLNRKAWNLRPGQAFKLTWQPPEGPGWTGMVLRAGTIRYGTPTDGWITVEAVEDIFGTTFTVFDPAPTSDWNPSMTAPVAPAVQRLVEAPYQLVGTGRYVYALASRADKSSLDAEIWTQKSGTPIQTGTLSPMTPSGLLAADFSYRRAAVDTVGFTVTVGTGRDIQLLLNKSTDAGGLYRGDNIAIVDDEVVSWQTCTDNGDGTFTFAPVLRGVTDSIPVTHTAGTRVWFASEGMGQTDQIAYPADLTLTARILPRNPLGTLAYGSGVDSTITTASRSLNPNPPGGAKVKTHKYADWPATITDDALFAWIHRDRVAIGVASALIDQDNAGPYTPEGTLTLDILLNGIAIAGRTITGTTATSYDYTPAMRAADDADGTKAVAIRITPINGSKTGNIRTTPALVMTGAGMTFGMYAGGIEA